MNCATCCAPIREGQLHCADCLARRSLATYLEMQKPYLADVLAGRIELKLVYPVRGRFHVALAGEPTHAFCGQRVARSWFRKYEPLTAGLRTKLCNLCLEALERLEGEITSAEARP